MQDGARLIFVGGLHRSGTSPLARVLGACPEISGLTDTGVFEDEGQHIQDVYPRIRAYGGMGHFAEKPAAHLDERSPLANAGSAERLLSAWSPYWNLDRRFLLEKSPANLIMGRFLQTVFPGSALVVVIRHPIAVALAMQKWNPLLVARNGRRRRTIAGFVRHWVRAHELLRQDAAHLDRLHVLRYEDLVQDPRTHLDQLATFLRLDAPLDASGVRRGLSDAYDRTWAAKNNHPAGKLIRARLTAAYGSEIAEYGYDFGSASAVDTSVELSRLFRP